MWCHAEMLPDSPREMALIKETCRQGDFGKGWGVPGTRCEAIGFGQHRHQIPSPCFLPRSCGHLLLLGRQLIGRHHFDRGYRDEAFLAERPS
jgi:hypothetical protein